MLKWQSDAGMFGRQHNYWFSGYGDRVFHIKRLSNGRWALIVSQQFHSVQGGSAGSIHRTATDARSEAQRIACLWGDWEYTQDREEIRRAMRSSQTEDEYNRLYDRLYGDDV